MQDRELENVGIPIRWRIYLDPTQEREKELKVDSFFFCPCTFPLMSVPNPNPINQKKNDEQ
jgi:hypothetical protein